MAEIPKAYEPSAVEDKWYDFWQSNGCFTADPERVSDTRPAYSIVIPPPNVTGMLHMGHVLNNTIQDILARKARMDGKEVLWLPGTDHAGIATQVMVEKKLKKEEKKSRHDIGREKFLEHVLPKEDNAPFYAALYEFIAKLTTKRLKATSDYLAQVDMELRKLKAES